MDIHLRLLLKEYAVSRDPQLAIRIAEGLLRIGEASPVTVYEVEYEYLEGDRRDEKYSCGLYVTAVEAYTEIGKSIIERLDDYQAGGDDPDEILSPEIRELISSQKFKEAASLFEADYSDAYTVVERTI